MKYTSESVNDTKKLAEDISKSIKGDEVLCLYGDLGAGKTTFTKVIAQSLGFKDDITSPTFIIRADHENNGMYLYHFDWYRLEDKKDLEMIGFYDILGSGIVIIEWADKFKHVIDALDQSNVIRIYFKHKLSGSKRSKNNNIREIEVNYGNTDN